MDKTTNAKNSRDIKRGATIPTRRRRMSAPRPIPRPESFLAWITKFEGHLDPLTVTGK